MLASVRGLADDGFCRVDELFRALPGGTHRDRRHALSHAVRKGLVLERRDAEGRTHVALSSEGWRWFRSAAD